MGVAGGAAAAHDDSAKGALISVNILKNQAGGWGAAASSHDVRRSDDSANGALISASIQKPGGGGGVRPTAGVPIPEGNWYLCGSRGR